MEEVGKSGSRASNHYFNSLDVDESRRLSIQERLLREFEEDVYAKALEGRSDVSVLDIGCNNGELLMKRLGLRPEVGRIFGVEVDPGAVSVASARYGNRADFACCDCESSDFPETLRCYLGERDLSGFDFVNMSLIILHLENPFKVLKEIRKQMSPDGIVLVCDVDDSLDLAYPDDNGHFAKFTKVAGRLGSTGFRESGRQVYGYLQRAGFRDIKLVKVGPTTIGMSYDERDAFFHASFSYLEPHIERALATDRHDAQLAKDLEWIRGAYDEMEETFHRPDFFFQAGTVLFTARK